MNLSAFIANKIAFGKKNSFSATIVRVAIAAVALSVAVMIIGLSLIKGFQQGVKQKFYDNWGHIHITPYLSDPDHYLQEEKISLNNALFNNLKNFENVQSVAPFALQSVLLKSKEEMEGIVLKSNYQGNTNHPPLVEGKPIKYNDSTYSQDILLSKSLANKLKVKLNDKLRLYFILENVRTPKPRKGIVAGIFDTGLQEFDNQIAFCDQQLIQNVTKDSNQLIQGYEINVQDLSLINHTKEAIYTQLIEPPLYAYTLKERFANIFSWLGMMKTNERLIIGIMIIVAIMNMISTLLILILERTQMIGVFKSLGMRARDMNMIFINSAFRIIFFGMLIGNAIGFLLIFLQRQFGFIRLNPEVYYVKTAPAIYAWPSFILINIMVPVVIGLLMFIPILVIKHIKPVKALQFK